jgi:hypothetical protein
LYPWLHLATRHCPASGKHGGHALLAHCPTVPPNPLLPSVLAFAGPVQACPLQLMPMVWVAITRKWRAQLLLFQDQQQRLGRNAAMQSTCSEPVCQPSGAASNAARMQESCDTLAPGIAWPSKYDHHV